MTERGIDFGRHAGDYATYRPGFPASFYDRLGAFASFAGLRVLDLATGPGTIALELAARGADVLGTDVAEGQIEAARRAADELGLAERARFGVGSAEETGLAAGSFDLVTAGQCWHWFDGPAVLAEARRVLAPGGALAIAYYSYLAQHSRVAAETEALVLEFNPTWTMAGSDAVPPGLVDALLAAGFEAVEQFAYHHQEPFTHERWRGRIRTCNGVGSGSLSPEDVQRFDARLAELLAAGHPEPVDVLHRVWCALGRVPT